MDVGLSKVPYHPSTPVGLIAAPPSRRGLPAVFLGGLLVRAAAVALSTPEVQLGPWKLHAWPADHVAYLQWGRQAVERGVLTLYTEPPAQGVRTRISAGELMIHDGSNRVANYPPFGLYLIAGEGWLLRGLEGMFRSGGEGADGFVANTLLARAAFQAPGILFDGLMALAAAGLAASVLGVRSWGPVFASVWLLPPFWLDSCWWGQTESWVLAPLLACLTAMIRKRWGVAGVWWGIALGLKTQAVLFLPVWAMAWAMEASKPRGGSSEFGDPTESASRRGVKFAACRSLGPLAGVAVGVMMLQAVALPFWLTSGGAWLRESFFRNLVEEGPHTTLRAFNIWYVDLLTCYDTSVRAPLLGVPKEVWGQGLLLAALIGLGLFIGRSGQERGRGLLLFTGLWLLAAVYLPTRVHERYLLLPLAFLAVAAVGWRPMRAPFVGLVLIATLQVTVYNWLSPGADSWSIREAPKLKKEYERQAEEARRRGVELPPLDEALVRWKAQYLAQVGRQGAGLEWGVTAFSLAVAGAAVVAAWRIGRPIPA